MTTSTPVAVPAARVAVTTDRPRVVTTIDPDVEIHGRIVVRSDKCMLIEGTVTGEIVSAGTVIVAEGAAVRGPISARQLIVSGAVECPEHRIEVRGLLAMRKGGSISAQTIAYGDLEHERGARLSGELDPLELDPLELPAEERELTIGPSRSGAPVAGAPTVGAIRPALGGGNADGRPPAAREERAAGVDAGSAELEEIGAGPTGHAPLSQPGVLEMGIVTFTEFKPLQTAGGS